MTADLRVAVRAPDPVTVWQASCIAELEALPGTSVTTTDDPASGADIVVDLRPDAAAADNAPGGGPSPAAEVWWFGFGPRLDRDPDRVALELYVRGRSLMRVALIRESDGSVVHEGLLEIGSWWHPDQLQRVLRTPAGWPAAALRARLTASETSAGTFQGSERPSTPPDRDSPTPPRALLVAGAGIRRVIGAATMLTRHDDWHVGIVDAPIDRFLSREPVPPIRWLQLRPGHFSADPFAVERNGMLHILYEDFDQRAGIGTIHHVALGADGSQSEPQLVLDPGVHASYPFLVEHEGSTFMLPEVGMSGDLVLYEAIEFPTGWRPAATLLPGVPALDASVVRFEDRWWLFATRLDQGINHDLSVWHAADLFGPWTPLPGNPVKSDIRSSRPGGTPFVVDGVLYRPSQDDSHAYGGRLVINRVTALSPTAFREEPVRTVEPDPTYPSGLHTLSSAGRRTLVDGNGRRLVPSAFRRLAARQARAVGRKLHLA